jgi:hypothetical protein
VCIRLRERSSQRTTFRSRSGSKVRSRPAWGVSPQTSQYIALIERCGEETKRTPVGALRSRSGDDQRVHVQRATSSFKFQAQSQTKALRSWCPSQSHCRLANPGPGAKIPPPIFAHFHGGRSIVLTRVRTRRCQSSRSSATPIVTETGSYSKVEPENEALTVEVDGRALG